MAPSAENFMGVNQPPNFRLLASSLRFRKRFSPRKTLMAGAELASQPRTFPNLFAAVKLDSSRCRIMRIRYNAVAGNVSEFVEMNRARNSPQLPALPRQGAFETTSNFGRFRFKCLKPLYRERAAVLFNGNGNHKIC